MADLQKYLTAVSRFGSDAILDTAAVDSEISDEDYDTLYEAIAKSARPLKAGGITFSKAADREALKEALRGE